MEYAYTYGEASRLYLNVTNRCTNKCTFCIRYWTVGLGGAVLTAGEEPDFRMLQAAVSSFGSLKQFEEFIWCGYGEPTFRLELIKEAASWLRSGGAKIRLNTNGHACLIHDRDVLAELSQVVDRVSVSLNAPNCDRYQEICRPDPEALPGPLARSVSPAAFWDAMLDFLSRSPAHFEEVQASVVGHALAEEECDQCRSLARSLGIERFKVR